jgi:hypothetical protein
LSSFICSFKPLFNLFLFFSQFWCTTVISKILSTNNFDDLFIGQHYRRWFNKEKRFGRFFFWSLFYALNILLLLTARLSDILHWTILQDIGKIGFPFNLNKLRVYFVVCYADILIKRHSKNVQKDWKLHDNVVWFCSSSSSSSLLVGLHENK